MKVVNRFGLRIKPIALIILFIVLTALSLRAEVFDKNTSLMDVECKGHTLYNIDNKEPYYYENTPYPVYCYYDGTVMVIQNLKTAVKHME
jgi:hypothetical protein